MSGRSSRARRAAFVFALAMAAGCGRSSGGTGTGDGTGEGSRQGDPLRVAAASSLTRAFGDVKTAFEHDTGKKVEISFGSSGLLAKQLEQGAPFDVFAAANLAFVDEAVKSGACDGATKATYARGRLVVWSKDPASLPKRLEDLADARYTKVSIANPEHAPYGRAAQQALTKAGVWKTVEPRIVHGENIQQAFVYARTGNADVALVALSLAVTSEGAYVPVDPALHDPLDQALVLCKGGARGAKTNEARAFVQYLASEKGREIMQRNGFSPP